MSHGKILAAPSVRQITDIRAMYGRKGGKKFLNFVIKFDRNKVRITQWLVYLPSDLPAPVFDTYKPLKIILVKFPCL